jgi:hypothetical protein
MFTFLTGLASSLSIGGCFMKLSAAPSGGNRGSGGTGRGEVAGLSGKAARPSGDSPAFGRVCPNPPETPVLPILDPKPRGL